MATLDPSWAPRAGTDLPLWDRRLPNGLRVLVLPTGPTALPASPVAIELWVMAGTAAESPEEHGCAHLLEHMLFKPTRCDGELVDIASGVESLGGDVNAYTSHDETVFHATVPAGAMKPGMRALVAPVVRPCLEARELKREIGVVLEEIRQYDDDLASRAGQDMLEMLYGEHGYGRPVLGRRREVSGHTVDRLEAFHRSLYTADRMALVVVGPVDPDDVLLQAQVLLGSVPERGRPAVERMPDIPSQSRIRVRSMAALEAHIAMGWLAPSLPDPDACALDVVSVVVGYGEASRLSMQTRRQARSVTDAQAHFYAARTGGYFSLSATTTRKRIEQATADLLEQIEGLRRLPIDDAELERARAVLRSDVIYRRETVQGQATAIGAQLSIGGSLDSEARYFEGLEALTPERVRLACERWLTPEAVGIQVIVPKSGTGPTPRAVTQALRRQLRPAASVTSLSRRVGPHGIQSFEHPCGLKVRAIVDRSVPMAAGWLVWPGGLRAEATREAGISNMMGNLLTRGSEAIDGDRLAAEIEGMAAVLEGFSGRSSLGLHFECLTAGFPTLLRRTLECAISPTFDEEELEEERRVELEELEAEGDDLGGLAFRTAYALLYRGHPFARRIGGTKASLQALTPARLHRTWRDRYPLGRAVLGLCGDLDLDQVARWVEGLAPPTAAPPPLVFPGGPPRYPARPRLQEVPRAKEQAHFVLAYPGLAFGDERLPVLDVLVSVLGGQVGRLFHVLREQRGLVYNVSVSATEGIDAGHVAVYAACSPSRVEQAADATRTELARICGAPPLPAEVERAKAWLVGQHEVEMQRRSRVASQIAYDEAYGLGAGHHFEYPARVESVTPAAVQALARTIFDTARRVEAVVSRG